MNSTNLNVTNSAANLLSAGNHSNIKVYVRFRPICHEKSELPIDYEFNKNEIVLRRANQARGYCFDGIFDDQSKQQDLSEVIIDPFIQQVIDGFNCTVLAYGQTGTGKTYTIEGDYLDNIRIPTAQSSTDSQQLPNQAGLVPRAFYKLFDRLKPDDQFKVSVIEIYNEDVFDLLADNPGSLRIYENQGHVTLNNLKEFVVNKASDLDTILHKSNSQRQFASTLMNKRSSRSHVIFQFVFSRKETLESNQVVERVGKLNLVDLAGSECAKRTGCQDIRALEASNINKSLLTLTRVIDALVKKQHYIPFRASNLTRIIQDTLAGNSRTILIATLSPALVDFEDTINTLQFASAAKQVKTNASANVKVIQNNYLEERIKELEENLMIELNKNGELRVLMTSEMERLKQEYDMKLRSKDDDLVELGNQLENKDDHINRLKRDIGKLNDQLISTTQSHQENETLKQPATKKQRLNQPLSNAANGKLRKSTRVSNAENPTDQLMPLIKTDVNVLVREQKSLTTCVNKLKKLQSSLDEFLKMMNQADPQRRIFCSDRLEENLGAFLCQMFNITIQDEFDFFLKFLTSEVQDELSKELGEELGQELVEKVEQQFTEFTKDVHDKLEIVKETIEHSLAAKDKELEEKTKVIDEIRKLNVSLRKEISDVFTRNKNCKEKVNHIKSVMTS